MQKENSHTDKTKTKQMLEKQAKIVSSEVTNLFPTYIGKYKLEFSQREVLFNLTNKFRKKYNSRSQSSGEIEKSGDFYTIGGFQMNLFENLGVHNFTDLRVEHGITQEEEDALKTLAKTFRIISNDFAENYSGDFFDSKGKVYYKNWFVMYDKNSFQEIHSHSGGNLWTQVYFLKLPKDLKYIGSKPHRKEGSLVITNNSPNHNGSQVKYITPEEDMVVMFQGKFPHYTLPMISEGYRCVIVNDFYTKDE
tara:strand:- start:60 stop:809 length:750 start_codon:yes stop_codon:yes gene_type:complete